MPVTRLVIAIAFGWTACAGAQGPADRFVYQDLPARWGFPVAEATLLGYVLADDQASVRRHAWELGQR